MAEEKKFNSESTNPHAKTTVNSSKEIGTVPFYKLFSFADHVDYLLMIVGTVAAIGNGVSMPLMTVVFGSTVNYFGANQTGKDLVHGISELSLKFVYLGLGSGLASFLQVTCWMVTGQRQASRIRSKYMKTILRQEIGFHDKETSSGEVVERMSGDTLLIQEALGEKVGTLLQLASTFIGGFVIALIKGWLLTLVMLSSIPLLVISGAVLAVAIARLASQGQSVYSQAGAIVHQTIGSIRTVASFTGEKQAIAEYDDALNKAYESGVREGLATGFGSGMFMLIILCSYALAIWYGGKMIYEKGYNGGDVINVLFAILTGSTSLGQASLCLRAFAAGQAAAYKMFETIQRKPHIDASDTKGKKLDHVQGYIELKDVCFSYPTRPDERIFDGLCFSIPSGITAALVGRSGSGKSTVISLIERFYDPEAGEVLIDGTNLKEFQLKWLRDRISLVSQEPALFTCSIKDNILYGKDDATDEEIQAAVALANASNFIDKLPQGINTMVGEHGTQLSGGQKQRVAIARAVLKDPRILLLDEATSALDAESERIVQEALERVMVSRTTVIVAHRLSTVKNADMIAVLQRGKIVEQGSHSELLKDPDGAYSHLICLQEMSKEPEMKHSETADQDKISVDSGRHPSERLSFHQSISPRSSGVPSSSRRSFSVAFGVPAGTSVTGKSKTFKSDLIPSNSETSPHVSLFRLASLNMPEIPVLLLGTLSAAANGAILPVFTIILSRALKVFYGPKDKLGRDSRFWTSMLVVLAVSSLLAFTSMNYFFSVAGYKLINKIRTMCFEKVVHMEISWFDKTEHTSGAIGARLSADAASLRLLVGAALGLLVQNIGTALAGLVIAFLANWELALIILVLLPLIAVSGHFQLKLMKGFSTDAKKRFEEASQVATDAVGSIRTVASFCAEEKVMQLYQKKCEGPLNTGIRQGLVSGIGFGLSLFFLFSVYGASFYAGARLVEDGKTTFEKVFQVLFALSLSALGISQSGGFFSDTNKGKIAAASIFAILDQKSQVDSREITGTVLDDVKGEIEFCNVSFAYPTRPDIQIFRDLSLYVHSNKTIALVGESGSGKSTMISMLQRFYDPDSGEILLDGIEIRKLQLRWLRQQMGLVSQEPVLFSDTIRANIAYGKERIATESEVVAAAELANAHNFISSLQQGYDTMVGERGIQLSGGQKQRVAIARAIMKAPKILLLDEATSALDAESEKVVQDALNQVIVNRTTIVVAHRLSTIKDADMIAVVKNGVIAEKGKHEMLINIKDGIYASLVALHSSDTSSL